MGTRAERKLRLATASLFFNFLRTRPLEANPFKLCSPSVKILVIRQQNQMGDMLLATPCLRALRENLPASELYHGDDEPVLWFNTPAGRMSPKYIRRPDGAWVPKDPDGVRWMIREDYNIRQESAKTS